MFKKTRFPFVFFLLLLSAFIVGCKPSTKKIDAVYDSLFVTADLTKVVDDLTFPKEVDGVVITYKSSHPEIISNTGKVVRQEKDVIVEVEITLKDGDLELKRTISVAVLKLNPVDPDPVDPDPVDPDPVDPNPIDPDPVDPDPVDPDPVDPNYSISRTKSASIGSQLTIKGIIIGIVGDSAYIHDGETGTYLYRVGTTVKVGDEVKLSGTIDDYKGLRQLKDLKDTQIINQNQPLPISKKINSLSEITEQSELYTIDDLTIVSVPSSYPDNNNHFIKVKDSNNKEMEIIISKYLSKIVINEIISILSNVKAGDVIGLSNIISGYFNAYQLQVVNANHFTIKTEDIVRNPVTYYPNPDDMEFLQNKLKFEDITMGISSIGESNVLIIPVEFSDDKFTQDELEKLEKAFFGTEEETEWESVQSYYQKSSYNKFTFNGTILAPFNTNKQVQYYDNNYQNGLDADYEILKAVLEYYDNQINYADYDTNDDGYIDGIYLIYSAPVNYDNDESLYWAYVYQYFSEDYEYYDGVEANYYLWAGIDFIIEALIEYGEGEEDVFVNINASTFIHETGHMLGLDDYYDYNSEVGPDGGLGGADMMDYTVGDHNPFSKIMLNWTTPYVVSNQSTMVTLNPFVESGNVLLVSTNWNNSYFDEYFLIDLYTPTSINADHAGYNGLFSNSGIRIYHIDARIDPMVGSPQNENGYFTVFSFNNSDTSHKLIKIIEADNNNSIENTGYADDSDLFQAGDIFGSNYRLHNGQFVNFRIEISSITESNATINIVFN